MQFHRQLIAAGDIHEKTLEVLFEVKEYIKRLEEKNKRFKSDVQPQLAKKDSAGEVEVPKNYGSGLSPPNRRSMLVVLYQHFLFNIKEQQKEQGVEEFVLGVEKNLFEVSRGDLNIYNREVKKICQHFYADSCRTAKLRMLRGEISAKDVALNKSEAFMSDESLQKYQENIKQETISTNADFYKEHLRKIHGGSCEECRFCRKKSAYCESMKQTRAADEPMTRFMRCSKCDRGWKD